jgi:hypothetical protein
MKPKIDKKTLTIEQSTALEQYEQNQTLAKQLIQLKKLGDSIEGLVFFVKENETKQPKFQKEIGSLLVDIRESLTALTSKKTPEYPDYAKPVVEALKPLEKAIKAIDMKPQVTVEGAKIESPDVKVDLKGVEKIVKDIPKAFKDSIKLIPKPEKTDFKPLLKAWEGISEQLVSIETATRMKPLPGSIAINNFSDMTGGDASAANQVLQTALLTTIDADTGNIATEVAGLLTDTELRASPVPVSGTVEITNDLGAEIPISSSGIDDTNNSTETPLLAGATFTGTGTDISRFASIGILVHSNVASATDGLSIQFSADNSDWHVGETFTVAANKTKFFTPPAQMTYYRIVYTNGGTNQTTFHLHSTLKTTAIKWSSHRIQDNLVDEDDGTLNVSVIKLRTSQDTYVSAASTTSGNFKMSLEELENNISVNSNSQLKITPYDSTGTEITPLTDTQLRATPVPVSGTVTATPSVTGGGTEATAQRVTIANDSTGVLSVDDNGGSLTVDGTVGISGTVPVSGTFWQSTQPVSLASVPSHAVTNAGTFAVQVSSALPAGTNAIGKLAANSGVDIGDVDVTSIAAGTNIIGGTYPTPSGATAQALSNDTSTAYEASSVTKASAGTVYGVTGYNSRTTGQFFQFYNSTTVPADATAPVITIYVAAQSNFSIDFGVYGRRFSTGIAWSNSSTGATKTIGSADMFVDVNYV